MKITAELTYNISVKGVGHDQISKERYCGYLFDDCGDVINEIKKNFHTIEIINKKKSGSDADPNEKMIKMDIYEEYSYPRYFLQGIFTVVSVTLLPLNYPRHFEVKMYLMDKDKNIEKIAKREFTIHHVWWLPMGLVYPFYNERRAVERAILNTGKELAIEIEK